MNTINRESFSAYKVLNSHDARLQSLTLEELLKNTSGRSVDYSNITYSSKPQAMLTASAWDCGLGIGYVVFDCLCLLLGAVALRSALTAEAAEEMAEAAKPVANKLTKYVEILAASESTKTEVATAVFGVISTIYSGSCLGAVLSAFLGSLTWYQSILYGATAMGTIVAAVATDGFAEIGMMVVELATAGFLVNDSIKCHEACS